MSHKHVIRAIRALIHDKGLQQEQLKKELKKRHGAATPAQMRESFKARAEITACLNYLHFVRDCVYPVHDIPVEYVKHYTDYWLWLAKSSADTMDIPEEPRPSKPSFLIRLLTAIGCSYKG